MRCRNCGWENDLGAFKCDKCNAPLNGSMVDDRQHSRREDEHSDPILNKTVRECDTLHSFCRERNFIIKHIVTFDVLSNNVDVKISNSFFTDEETKVIIKSIAFKNILKIFTKDNIEKHKEEDRFYADLISEFIEKEYYKYGPDLGTAIYIYENKKYFKEYIYGEKEAKNFLNFIIHCLLYSNIIRISRAMLSKKLITWPMRVTPRIHTSQISRILQHFFIRQAI